MTNEEVINVLNTIYENPTASEQIKEACIVAMEAVDIKNSVERITEGLEISSEESEAKDLDSEKGWISAKERLPKERDWYLGIFKENDTGWINPIPFVCDYVGHKTPYTTSGFWILHGLTDIDNGDPYYKDLVCVAWQPLPEPYEPKEETK